MTDLERRALLGDRQAQEECTRQGILLPCPFCGYGAELVEKDDAYSVVCKDWYCIANDIQPEYDDAMVALAVWNTRPAPPVGRCEECANRKTQECSMYYTCACGEQHTWETNDDFCSRFIPKESEENAAD